METRFELPKDNPRRRVSYLKKYSRYFWIQTAGGVLYNTVIVAGPILLGEMLDAVIAFLKDPHAITIALAPPKPLPLATFGQLGAMDPNDVPALLGLTIQ